MHDGESDTLEAAIARHAGQSIVPSRAFENLNAADTAALLAFRRSL